jgi:hypothetical protein
MSSTFAEDTPRPRVETLAVAEIKQDEDIVARERTDIQIVSEYRLRMLEGDVFPPLEIIQEGDVFWLIDGAHRLEAARSAGLESVRCSIRKGNRREAILASCAANAEHGVRRSTDDKRRAVDKMLKDAEWSRWSDREIARQCRVSHPFVAERRRPLTGNVATERLYTNRYGAPATMNVVSLKSARDFVGEPIRVRIVHQQPPDPTDEFSATDLVWLERLVEKLKKTSSPTGALAVRIKAVARRLTEIAEGLPGG